MDCFLWNVFLLHSSTQSTLYNTPHSGIDTSASFLCAYYLTFTHIHTATNAEQLGVQYLAVMVVLMTLFSLQIRQNP